MKAKEFCFHPISQRIWKKNKANDHIIDIINECCKLEDIFELIPTKYTQTLRILQNRIIEILKQYDEESRKKWVIIDEEHFHNLRLCSGRAGK